MIRVQVLVRFNEIFDLKYFEDFLHNYCEDDYTTNIYIDLFEFLSQCPYYYDIVLNSSNDYISMIQSIDNNFISLFHGYIIHTITNDYLDYLYSIDDVLSLNDYDIQVISEDIYECISKIILIWTNNETDKIYYAMYITDNQVYQIDCNSYNLYL